MLFVHKPNPFSVPGACVLIPGRTADERGFIDTTTELDGLNGPIHIYLSAEGVRTAAAKFPQLGLVDRAKLEAAEAENTRLNNDLMQANARAERAEQQLDRVAGLSKSGFKVQRVMGRPAQKERK